jgi:hypothetical protein
MSRDAPANREDNVLQNMIPSTRTQITARIHELGGTVYERAAGYPKGSTSSLQDFAEVRRLAARLHDLRTEETWGVAIMGEDGWMLTKGRHTRSSAEVHAAAACACDCQSIADRALIVPNKTLKDAAKVEADIDAKLAAAIAGHDAAVAKALVDARREIKKLALNPLYSQVIAIAHGQDDNEIEVIYGDDEARVISEYSAAVSARTIEDSEVSARYGRAPRIGGHNTLFDVRFLFKRAVMLGVALPRFWPFDASKDWDSRIVDTGQIWSPGMFASLDDTCLETGGPGKDGIDGSMVDGLHQAGDWDTIVRYAKGDLQDRTRPAYHRMIAAIGMGPLASIQTEITVPSMALSPGADVIPDFLQEAM